MCSTYTRPEDARLQQHRIPGRTGLYEVMPISDTLREMILNRASAAEIKEQAVREGMDSLRSDGIWKIKNGITSLEEVLRRIGGLDRRARRE